MVVTAVGIEPRPPAYKPCLLTTTLPPHMYDDVRAHIQEMLDIGAICKLHSPWASVVVVLV